MMSFVEESVTFPTISSSSSSSSSSTIKKSVTSDSNVSENKIHNGIFVNHELLQSSSMPIIPNQASHEISTPPLNHVVPIKLPKLKSNKPVIVIETNTSEIRDDSSPISLEDDNFEESNMDRHFHSPWAAADIRVNLSEANSSFLRICSLNKEIFKSTSIIELVKHSTPEIMQQQAYMLDQLASDGTNKDMKWVAELKETEGGGENYALHVSVADEPTMDHKLDVVLREKEGHVIGGQHEIGLRQKSAYLQKSHSPVPSSGKIGGGGFGGGGVETALRILVVDDSLISLKVLTRLIQNQGHFVECRPNGAEALECLKENHYDAVLMALNMPEMGGLEASSEFRQHEQLMFQFKGEKGDAKLKIIAMSPDLSEKRKQEILDAGFDNYISKPVSKEAFMALKLKSIVQ